MDDSDSDWMDKVKATPVPAPEGYEIPEPECWYLAPVKVGLDGDGQIEFSWREIESPNLAAEWPTWKPYLPDRVWFN